MAGKYIIVFKDSVTEEQFEQYKREIKDNGGQINSDYGSLMKGFAATVPENYLLQLQSLQGNIIESIEPDSTVSIQ